MFKKSLSVLLLFFGCLIFTSSSFAEKQPKNIYDSGYIQIEFDELKLLSNGKIIVFFSYSGKESEDLHTSTNYYIELNDDKDSQVNTFLIDNLGNQYPLINAQAFEPNLPVILGAKAKGVMMFSNDQKTESIDYSKILFTLVSEQTVTVHNKNHKIHVVLRLY
jgi:hypothetical protein